MAKWLPVMWLRQGLVLIVALGFTLWGHTALAQTMSSERMATNGSTAAQRMKLAAHAIGINTAFYEVRMAAWHSCFC